VASTLNLFRNGAVGFIDLLDGGRGNISRMQMTASQENDAVAGRSLGFDCGYSPDNKCGDRKTDQKRDRRPPTAKHNTHAYAHQEDEQDRQTPAE
jgi:hypothetical protein